MEQTRLIVADPGHFHASLVQKEMYPDVAKRVAVYAPLGADVIDYLQRVARFNTQRKNPTAWEIDLHASPDFFERMLAERRGNVVILAGRNRPKIGRILASIDHGINVLADKPWIIAPADLPKLEQALDHADRKHLVAYDIMTERYEITSILQRELVRDPEIFGAPEAVTARSVHHLMKVVAGLPLRRPVWFFDIDEYGEGLADVGTHVVDLMQWTAFADQILDYRKDVQILDAKRWPTVISQPDFERVTGESMFPAALTPHVKEGKLEYFCNNSIHYKLRGVDVALEILWNWEAPAGGGDIYEASFRGSKARVEIRQTKDPELYVTPDSAALRKKIAALQAVYPGLSVEGSGEEVHIVIPGALRVSHEDHFAQVTRRFFEYLHAPQSMPAWEKANMLVKYYISTYRP